MNITCSSDKPLLYIQKKLHLYDITSYVYKEKENKYKLMCTNKNSIIFLIDRLYYTDDLFCLKRKYEKINIYKSGSAAQKYVGNKRGKSENAKLKNTPTPR